MRRAFEKLHKAICVVTALIMIVITGLTFYQVVCRYVFNNASSWSEEMIRYLFVWVSVFGAAIGVHEHIHIGIDVAVNLLPKNIKIMIHIAVQLAIIGVCALLVRYGINMVGRTAMQISPALHLPMKYVYMAAPVGGIMLIIYVLEEIVIDIGKLKEGQHS